VGRYGGEEFLVVLNNCESHAGIVRAEEIRKAMNRKPVLSSAGPIRITASVGIVFSKEWAGTSTEELLHDADKALYEARGAGRNCVTAGRPTKTILNPSALIEAPSMRP